MSGQPVSGGVPLVLHVVPTAVARGAQREARALADQLDRPGVRVHRVLSLLEGPHEVATDFSLDHRGGVWSAVGFDLPLILKVRAALARLGPAVLVAHGGEPLKYLVPALVGQGMPLAYYAIGTYAGSGSRAQLAFWRRLVSQADVVAAEGEEVRQECIDLLGAAPHRVAFTPNGRDPDVFFPADDRREPGRPRVVFVGALAPGKRPDRFIEVVKRVRGRGVDFAALVIGDGPLRASLEAPADVAGVELLGSRSDVAEQMRRADLMVFPSMPTGEGMPGVLIEAGLSGVPVVATDVPGVRSIVADGETGYVVGIDDVEAMVAATARLLDDPAERSAMGVRSRQRCIDNFSLTAVGDRWMSLLQPLVDTALGTAR